jgi:hypothetical protein
VVVKGENTSVDVKRLPKKPAPPRFGRKLSATQKANATHVCIDCGARPPGRPQHRPCPNPPFLRSSVRCRAARTED